MGATDAASSLSFSTMQWLRFEVSLAVAVTQTEVQRQTKMRKKTVASCERSLLVMV